MRRQAGQHYQQQQQQQQQQPASLATELDTMIITFFEDQSKIPAPSASRNQLTPPVGINDHVIKPEGHMRNLAGHMTPKQEERNPHIALHEAAIPQAEEKAKLHGREMFLSREASVRPAQDEARVGKQQVDDKVDETVDDRLGRLEACLERMLLQQQQTHELQMQDSSRRAARVHQQESQPICQSPSLSQFPLSLSRCEERLAKVMSTTSESRQTIDPAENLASRNSFRVPDDKDSEVGSEAGGEGDENNDESDRASTPRPRCKTPTRPSTPFETQTQMHYYNDALEIDPRQSWRPETMVRQRSLGQFPTHNSFGDAEDYVNPSDLSQPRSALSQMISADSGHDCSPWSHPIPRKKMAPITQTSATTSSTERISDHQPTQPRRISFIAQSRSLQEINKHHMSMNQLITIAEMNLRNK